MATSRRISGAIAVSTAVLVTVAASLLSGCHTTAGFGQDMQSAGKSIENSADKNK